MGGELIIPVIMCGGAGTRLWPVSRESMPKQFVPLIDERSTFQQVVGRISNADLFDRPIVITHSDFRFVAAEQLRQCDVEADVVLEPSRRDLAMAVAVAAELAARRRPQACVLVLAADHVVRNAEALENACQEATKAAAAGSIVTFGITPTYPGDQLRLHTSRSEAQRRRSACHRGFRGKAEYCKRPAPTLQSAFSGTVAIFCFAPM